MSNHKPVVCIGNATIDRLRRGEMVEFNEVALIPADDLVTQPSPTRCEVPGCLGDQHAEHCEALLCNLIEHLRPSRTSPFYDRAVELLGPERVERAYRHGSEPPAPPTLRAGMKVRVAAHIPRVGGTVMTLLGPMVVNGPEWKAQWDDEPNSPLWVLSASWLTPVPEPPAGEEKKG